ncbi:hypothetical protein [Epibacterium ulvae]|uniref:hypothetical protein n=1 Tax=Epibacterium ulvae TaxID=1156985 RepID=UPI00248F9DA6|nr:hypothetical protein [Epibacterium ulvae]
MTDLTLAPIRFENARWEGRVSSRKKRSTPPAVQVMWQDAPLKGVEIEMVTPGLDWDLVVPIPSEAVGESAEVFLIINPETNQTLGHFTLNGGPPPADDLRAEVELLRAELDMLKRAFRRHCLETS